VHPELIAGMTDNDHIFPRFILGVMPHGLRGLLLAAVASAAMGSADSALASLSTAFTMDFYKPFWSKKKTEAQIVRMSKLSFVGFGLFFMGCALCLRRLDNLLWLAFRLIAFTYGPLLGIFIVTIMTDWRLSARQVRWLMIIPTLITFALAMAAWGLSSYGPFWGGLHQTYWRLYVIFGTLFVPAGAFFLREKPEPRAA
jgi:Na+/proline symporter